MTHGRFRRLLLCALLCTCALPKPLIARAAAVADAALPLAAAIATALRVAPQVRQAAHLRAAGRYGARAASRAALLPQLSLAGGIQWTKSRNQQPLLVANNGPRESVGLLQVALPVYAPQLRALARLARSQEAVARSEQAESRLRVAAQVADAWYQLALLRSSVRIWQSTLRSVDVLYRGARQQYAVGAAAALDLAQTQLLRHNAESGLQQARAQRSAAQRVLNLLLARAPLTPLVLPALRPPTHSLPTEPIWIEQARRAQPLLRTAAQQIAVGHAQVGVQRAARLPTVSASAGYGFDTLQAPGSRNLGWEAFLGMSVPIVSFGQQRDRIADAEEQVAALRSARQALLLTIDTTIARDYGNAQAAERSYREAVKQRRDARSVYDMTRDGYKAGTLNALNLAQAENSWLQARLQVATTLVLLRMARTQLRLDAGAYPGERSAA